MRITLLGTAAGGGFPQWNCHCRNCAGVRGGTVRAQARTQSSIFIQPDDGADGVLVNASPDILQQIKANPHLQPGRADRDTAIAGVILSDGQVDHTTGLMMLRERGAKLPLWCTEPVAEDLTQGYPLLRILGHFCGVDRQPMPIDGSSFRVPGVDGLLFTALPLTSKAAPYSPHREAPVPGDNIGLSVLDERSGKRLFYAPGLGEAAHEVTDAMRQADVLLVEGTFWTDDEMIGLGFSKKTARSIGHLPQSGTGGMIELLRGLPRSSRKVLVHINNTNPILDEDSSERAALAAEGIEVGEDGWVIAC
jgi:pyrroloquinoline quinone biosynthesis protein B